MVGSFICFNGAFLTVSSVLLGLPFIWPSPHLFSLNPNLPPAFPSPHSLPLLSSDILCQCQHDGCHILDLNLMRDILASCDRTLLVLDREASSLNRTVCLWEVWMTSCLDK